MAGADLAFSGKTEPASSMAAARVSDEIMARVVRKADLGQEESGPVRAVLEHTSQQLVRLRKVMEMSVDQPPAHSEEFRLVAECEVALSAVLPGKKVDKVLTELRKEWSLKE